MSHNFSSIGKMLDYDSGVKRQQVSNYFRNYLIKVFSLFDQVVERNVPTHQSDPKIKEQSTQDDEQMKLSHQEELVLKKYQLWKQPHLINSDVTYISKVIKNQQSSPQKPKKNKMQRADYVSEHKTASKSTLPQVSISANQSPRQQQIRLKLPAQTKIITYDYKKKFMTPISDRKDNHYLNLCYNYKSPHDSIIRDDTEQSEKEGKFLKTNLMTNLLSQIQDKYKDRQNFKLTQRNINNSKEFNKSFMKKLTKFRPFNSSLNPQVNINNSINTSYIARSESPVQKDQQISLERIAKTTNRLSLPTKKKKILDEESYQLWEYIEEQYKNQSQEENTYLQQLHNEQLYLDQYLNRKKFKLKDDQYDYEKQVSMSFHEKERLLTLREVKQNLLSQMPVTTINLKNQRHQKKFMQDRIQKNFPLEDIYKYLKKSRQ